MTLQVYYVGNSDSTFSPIFGVSAPSGDRYGILEVRVPLGTSDAVGSVASIADNRKSRALLLDAVALEDMGQFPGPAGFFASLHLQRIGRDGRDRPVWVFTHDRSSTFEEAVRWSALLASDLGYVPIVYSWPSRHLSGFIRRLSAETGDSVHWLPL